MMETYKPLPHGFDPYNKCFDCKWPLDAKVCKTCSCPNGKGREYDYHEHQLAVEEAKRLLEDGVPFEDERYYI